MNSTITTTFYLAGLFSLILLWSSPKWGWKKYRFFMTIIFFVVVFYSLQNLFIWHQYSIYIFFVISFVLFYLDNFSKLVISKTTKKVFNIVLTSIYVISIILFYSFPVVKLQIPTGEFYVGTNLITITDQNRDEIFTEKEGDFRRFRVQMWFPLNKFQGTLQKTKWIQGGNIVTEALAKDWGIPGFILDHTNMIDSNSYFGGEILKSEDKLPLVIISHGWGGFMNLHTNFAEDLASKGFIVASIDHTFGSVATVFSEEDVEFKSENALPYNLSRERFLDNANTVIKTYGNDVISTIDYFENSDIYMNHIDFDKISLIGHSTGGGGAIYASSIDNRIKAVIGLDAWVEPLEENIYEKVSHLPILLLRSEEWENHTNNEYLYNFLNNDKTRLYQIKETTHSDFTMAYMFSSLTEFFGITGNIDYIELNSSLRFIFYETFSSIYYRNGETINYEDYYDFLIRISFE